MGTTALMTDRYELSMLTAAIGSGIAGRRSVFEVFARGLPPGRRYGVFAGLGRLVEAIGRFRFDGSTLEWLLKEAILDERSAAWLEGWTFDGSIDAYHEGECFFPGSPVLTVEASFGSAVILETIVLSVLNFDSAVAAAASRMVQAARGRPIIEMGSRRVEEHAAIAAARAAYLAGFASTSNLEAGHRYGIPTAGTSGHAFVLAHESEAAAFEAQLRAMGASTTLLVDTFDPESAIATAVAGARGQGSAGPGALRLDSGDLASESLRARRLLDDLGARETGIVVTGDLDEGAIAALASAPVDSYGVGTSVVTGAGAPTAGLVYKLVAIAREGGADAPLAAVAKRSPGKSSPGGRKQAVRLVDRDGQARVELLEIAVEGRAGSSTADRSEGDLERRELQHSVVAGGLVADGLDDLEAAREHHRWSLRELGPRAFELSAGEPLIPTRYREVPGLRQQPGARGKAVAVSRPGAEVGAPAGEDGRLPRGVRRALLAVDVQRDFCEGGSLPVEGGNEVAGRVAAIARNEGRGLAAPYAALLASRDWHVDPGEHFAADGELPDFSSSWPPHCRAGSEGAELHPALRGTRLDATFDKGREEAAFSAFEGTTADGRSLGEWLLDAGIEQLDVCGIATDHCVRATVLDACQLGFGVRVLLDCTAGVDRETTAEAVRAMSEAGAEIVARTVSR